MVAIDISYAQTTNINFVAMRAAVDTVIMKAGGSNSGRYVDSKYRWFEPRARAAGMRIGHYWFNGTGDAVTDADWFVDNLSGYQPQDLLALDIESEGSMPYASPAWALAFVNRVKQRTGRNCDVYMSSSVTRAQNWSAVRDAGAKLWVAQYGTNSGVPQGSPNISYWPTYKLWQYSSNGSVPGYAARVDINTVNESQWDGGGAAPIIPQLRRKTMFLSMDTAGSGFIHSDAGKTYAFGPVIDGVSGMDQYNLFKRLLFDTTPPTFNTIEEVVVQKVIAKLAPDTSSVDLTDAQVNALATSISGQITPGASKAEVTAIVNGAVTNLAQNNADQTAVIKGLTFKAQ